MSISSVISRFAARPGLPVKGWGTALVLTTALVGASSLPANAQFFNFWGGGRGYVPYYNNYRPGPLPPSAVFRILSRQGFRFTSPIERNGWAYQADVIDPDGQRARVVIDSSNGTIVQTFAAAPRPRGYIPEPGLVARSDPYPPDGRYPLGDIFPPGNSNGQSSAPNVIPGVGPHDLPHVRTREAAPRIEPLTKSAPHTKKSPTVAARTPAAVTPPATQPAVAPSPGGSASPSITPAAPRSTAKVEPPAGAASSEPEATPASNAPTAAPATDMTADKASAAPVQASAPPAEKQEKQEKPGYANGVPVNPLD